MKAQALPAPEETRSCPHHMVQRELAAAPRLLTASPSSFPGNRLGGVFIFQALQCHPRLAKLAGGWWFAG